MSRETDSAYRVEYSDSQIISVLHDGNITWDQLQAIKNRIWGEDAEAIECYPSKARTINNANQRHLWRVPDNFPLPDLIDGWAQHLEDFG